MRLLCIDPAGAGLDICWRAKRAGHEARLFMRRTPKTEFIGKGMVDVRFSDRASLWENMKWADLIFLADNTRWLQEVDRFRQEFPQKAIVGPSAEAAAWELDRDVGMKMFRRHGIDVAPCREFDDYDEAIRYVIKRDTRLVSKPSGDADKALSYCAKSPADMVYMLQRWKKNGKLKKAPFILQDFTEGVEMAVGGWFGPHGFSEGWCENFEFKKLMNGDLGVATGEQGTVLAYVRKSKLADTVLRGLTAALHKVGYVGYIDVNCIIDVKGKPWPLEFTMRPGWPTFNIQQHLHQKMECPITWMYDLFRGEDSSVFILDMPAVGVVLSIPDYPYSHITRKEVVGTPVYGITEGDWHWLSPCEMMLAPYPDQKNPSADIVGPATAGDYVCVVHGHNDTIQEARQKVYRRLKTLLVPNSPMYRTDIGLRLGKQLGDLQKHGYASKFRFS
jgi:phosphoribosylamine---glycine ligase